jgi:hypothetical protein
VGFTEDFPEYNRAARLKRVQRVKVGTAALDQNCDELIVRKQLVDAFLCSYG